MDKKKYWIILLLALTMPACLFTRTTVAVQPTSSPIPSETAVQHGSNPAPGETPVQAVSASPVYDIAYAQHPGSDIRLTSLDIYPAASGVDLPVMIFVHGGGWRNGFKRDVQEKPAAFNAAGYLFISINYRLLPEADVPTQAGDVAEAIAWVHEHAAEYGGDPQQIFLMGHSAGAHLVALVGSDPSYLEKVGLSLSVLHGVVALDTRAYDVPAVMNDLTGPEAPIYRQAFGTDPAFWERVSPLHYVKAGNGIPPFLVAYSGQGADRPGIAESFVEALKEAGITAELLPAPEKTHAEINRQFGEPGDAVTHAVLAFLAKIRQ